MHPEQLRPLGTRFIARKYERPERVGSIWLNPAWRQDNSRSLWEPVLFSEGALKWFRENLAFDLEGREVVLVTQPNMGTHLPMIDDPKEHYMLRAEWVQQIIPYDEKDTTDEQAA